MLEETPEPIINIWGEKVALGPLSRDLLPLYTRWVNSFEVVLTLGLAPAPIAPENESEFFDVIYMDCLTSEFQERSGPDTMHRVPTKE